MHRSSQTVAEASAAPFDRRHLAQQTGGDLALQRELLEMFRDRAPLLLDAMQRLTETPQAPARALCDLAHQLKGSALAIGAFNVALAAGAVEGRFAGDPCGGRTDAGAALAALAALAEALALALPALDAHLRALAAETAG